MTSPSDIDSFAFGFELTADNYSGGAGGTFQNMVAGGENWKVESATPVFTTESGSGWSQEGMNFPLDIAFAINGEQRAMYECTILCVNYPTSGVLSYPFGGSNPTSNVFSLRTISWTASASNGIQTSPNTATFEQGRPHVMTASYSPENGVSYCQLDDDLPTSFQADAGSFANARVNYWNSAIGLMRTTVFEGWISKVYVFSRALHFRDNALLQDLIETELQLIGLGPAAAPQVDAGGPYSGNVGVPTQISGIVVPGTDPNPTNLWTIESGGAGSFGDASLASTNFTPNATSVYELRLTSTGSQAESATDIAEFTAQVGPQPPLLDAGGPYSGTVNEAIPVLGEVTVGSDPAPTYQWTIDSGGGGVFSAPTSLATNFTPDTEAVYQIRLVATTTDTAPVASTASVNSQAPFLFSPADLFTGGELGAYYDISDISTLFQDQAGTIPVTASGQFVKHIKDLSGNGRHLTMSLDTDYWVYQITSGFPNIYGALVTVAANNQFITASRVTWDAPTTLAAGVINGIGGNSGGFRHIQVAQNSSNTSELQTVATSANCTARVRGAVTGQLSVNSNATGTYLNGTNAYILGVVDIAQQSCTFDSQPPNVAANNIDATTFEGDIIVCGNVGAAMLKPETRYFGFMVIDRLLTAQESSDMQAWLEHIMP